MKSNRQASVRTVKTITYYFGAGLICLLIMTLLLKKYVIQKQPLALNQMTITSQSLDEDESYYERRNGVVKLSLNQKTNGREGIALMTLPDNSPEAVIQFLVSLPRVEVQGILTQASEGVSEAANEPLPIVPDDPDNIVLTGSQQENGRLHYYFAQKRCGNVAVMDSGLDVHMQSDDIYRVSGYMTGTDETDCSLKITQSDARSKVTNYIGSGADVDDVRKVVFDQQLSVTATGQSSGGDSQFLAWAVLGCNAEGCRRYIVDAEDGEIVYSYQVSSYALKRHVELESGSGVRREGEQPVSDSRINKTYDILGQVYNYYQQTYQRDSYDNAGGLIRSYVVGTSVGCKDSQASWYQQTIYVCDDNKGVTFIGKDVLAHEFTHGVIQQSVGGIDGLRYTWQSGALNESIADVMASGSDQNWTMGEDSYGTIRDMKDPPALNQPDRLFSNLYRCTQGASRQEDYGGVHRNSGVFNKAVYLMSDGGTFPVVQGLASCTIPAIGRDKALKVVYKALTTYLKGKSTANYFDMYDGMNRACKDIFSDGSPECFSIKSAMEAVQMDQQPAGATNSPYCGTASDGRAPTCAGATPPSGTPVTGSPTASPSSSPLPSGQLSATPAIGTPTPTQPPTGSAPAKEVPLISSSPARVDLFGSVSLTYDGDFTRIEAKFDPAKSLDTNNLKLSGKLYGQQTVDTGAFTLEKGAFVNRFSTAGNYADAAAYQVFMEIGAGQKVPIFVGNFAGFPGTKTDPNAVNIAISLKFQGITKEPAILPNMLVRVGISSDSQETQYFPVVVLSGENGIWKGKLVANVEPGDDYKITVKGPLHIQRKFCDNTVTEKEAGTYVCPTENVSLKKGANTLDFSGVYQLAGDLNQDGVVNSVDISLVRNNFNKTTEAARAIADLNADGAINTADDGLVIFTLANRTDQF